MQSIIIQGAGVVGLTAAIALSKGYKIWLADQKPRYVFRGHPELPSRVFALSETNKSFLQSLGIWSHIDERRVAPIREMYVWEKPGFGAIQFESKPISALGYIIEEENLLQACHKALSMLPSIQYYPEARIQDLVLSESNVSGVIAGRAITADAILAAEGAGSSLREYAQIPTREKDYEEMALVSTITIEKPHQGRALQCYDTANTFAALPLFSPNQFSMVWSLASARAKAILTQDVSEVRTEIQTILGNVFGRIESVAPLAAFPLGFSVAKRVVKDRLVLLGDSAQRMHPHAGMGLQIGLLEVAALHEKCLTHINARNLARFEREVLGEIHPRVFAIDILHRLFRNTSPLVQFARGLGMTWCDRSDYIKNLIYKASGL